MISPTAPSDFYRTATLLNTLKKPKRRHLAEFYEDDDIELEMAANPKDPNEITMFNFQLLLALL